MSKKKIFVTGGSGFLGKRLLERLARDGHEVLALARSDRAAAEVERAGARPVQGSLENIAAWESALAGVDAVVHAAAPVEFWGPWERFQRSIVDATEALHAAAARQGARRFIHVSSESVLQDRDPLVDIDERHPYPAEPNSIYGRAKKLAEERLLASKASIDLIILRPTFIWGEGCPAFETLSEKARSGQFMWIDRGELPIEAVHVDNVVEAIVLALDRGEPRGIYFVTDAEPTTARDFFTRLFKALGLPQPTRSMPSAVARPLASAVEALWRAARARSPPPLTRFDLAFVAMPRRYKLDRIQNELGYRPVVTREEGFARLAAKAG